MLLYEVVIEHTGKKMGIKIRKATQDDCEFLAQMILQSSRAGKKYGIYDLLFEGANILEKLSLLTKTTAKIYCSYTNFLIAEIDNKPVGTLCSYEPRITTDEEFEKALLEVGCTAEALNHLRPLRECRFELDKRTLMFDCMEEIDGFIDVGVLKALMQKSLLNARLKGYRVAKSIVEIGSLKNIMYYKKLGFKGIDVKECELYKEVFGRAGLLLFAIDF